MSVLAVHIADGVLPAWLWLAGDLAALVLVALSLYRLSPDEVPRVAFAAAAFFVSSLIHVRVGPTSVHLLLNGLVGVACGPRAGLAIAVGLLFQALLIGHGGVTSYGVNVCVMTLPALMAWLVWSTVRTWSRGPRLFALGYALGVLTVVVTVALNAVVLSVAVDEKVAIAVFLAHVPVALVEGYVVAVAGVYLSAASYRLSDGE